MDDLPEDPHPDLTLLDLEPVMIRNGCGERIQLLPQRTVLALVMTRHVDGTPAIVKIL